MNRKHILVIAVCLFLFNLSGYLNVPFGIYTSLFGHKIQIFKSMNASPDSSVIFEADEELAKYELACIHPDCIQLSDNITTRVESLVSEKTMLTMAQDHLLRSIAGQIPENDVIIVTAASSNHYAEMQAMFHSLRTMVLPELSKRENFSVVLWDIGLSPTQRKQTEYCCLCQVISFPFEKFPDRVRDLHCYMWKPFIIRMALFRARKYVVWQDTSIRYKCYTGEVYDRAMRHGIQLLGAMDSGSIPHRTLPETFEYFGQRNCSFYQYPEVYATFGVYKTDPFVLAAVTHLWARCAFEQTCMCPRDSLKSMKGYYGPAHRFDQSALSIITATLYSSEVYRILFLPEDNKCIQVDREDNVDRYFQSTGCLSIPFTLEHASADHHSHGATFVMSFIQLFCYYNNVL